MFGAAPTARAARELRDGAGVDAGTLHALAGVLDRRGGFPRGSVLLDEAGMAATRVSARVFEHAERAGVKVIAVGDAGQLSSATRWKRYPTNGPSCGPSTARPRW